MLSLQKSKKAAVFLIFLLCMNCFSPLLAGEVVLKNNVTVQLELNQTLTSETVTVGQPITLSVKHDLKVDGQTVIKAGSTAEGRVAHVKKNSIMGQGGKIGIEVISVQAVDGSTIALSASQLVRGDEKIAQVVILTLLCIVGLFIKGESASLQAGSTIAARVVNDTIINVK